MKNDEKLTTLKQHYYEESPTDNSFEADVIVDENNNLRRKIRDTSGQTASKVGLHVPKLTRSRLFEAHFL